MDINFRLAIKAGVNFPFVVCLCCLHLQKVPCACSERFVKMCCCSDSSSKMEFSDVPDADAREHILLGNTNFAFHA